MISKIFYGQSGYKSQVIKGFFRHIENSKLLFDSSSEMINPNQYITINDETVFCFRSTDQIIHKRLIEDNPIKNAMGYLTFNEHLPWFHTKYLPPEKSNYNFIFYFDMNNSDIVYKNGEQLIQIGGPLDYGFYQAYNKLNLYLELCNEVEFLKQIQEEDSGTSSKIRQISLLSKISSIDDLGPFEEQKEFNEQKQHLYFSIEPFMIEQRQNLFKQQKTKNKKQQLNDNVTIKIKEQVANAFEKVIYKQIYYNLLILRNQYHKKYPNQECSILLSGKLTYNRSFRLMFKQICDKLGLKLVLHEQKYHNIIPYFINSKYKVQDIHKNPNDLSTFMNVSYGIQKPFQQVI